MIISVPREVKIHERRVAITPAGVTDLVSQGHRVVVETGAGIGSGFSDDRYVDAGAEIAPDAAAAWSAADMVVKVKEPVPAEYGFLRPGLLLFAYLHLAAEPELTRALLDSHTTSIAYETVQASDGSLPLLAPMSEIAGRLSVQAAAQCLSGPGGGRGLLLGGVPGTPRGRVVVIGGGVAGTHAAEMAIGLGARVCVIDSSLPRLRALEERFGTAIDTRASTAQAIADEVAGADVVIGSVLLPGAAAPKLVTLDMVRRMRAGSVLVDIAVDQGGCFEGTRPTTYEDPTYNVEGIIFYAVANMPGAVPVTSTSALTNATLPFVRELARQGWESATRNDGALALGIATVAGELRDPRVSDPRVVPAPSA